MLASLWALPGDCRAYGDDSLLDLSLEELLNIVTVRKREEKLITVPAAATNLPDQALQDYGVRSFTDYARKVPGLSFAYGNGFTVGNPSTAWTNSRTMAIRGVSSARATGLYIDDTPLPGAVDPRVLDLQNIEVLRGPQGSLFGEGSLGGTVRLVSRLPDLGRSGYEYSLAAGHSYQAGRPNASAELVGNVVLDEGRSALRISAFADDEAGYIRRTHRSDIRNPASARIDAGHQGGLGKRGASIAALFRVTPDLDLLPRVMVQDSHVRGFPASYAYPVFVPPLTMDRQADIQSSAKDHWLLPSLRLSYRGKGWTLSSSTSRFSRRTSDLEDSTEGGLYQAPTLAVAPMPWASRYTSRQLSHETRVAFEASRTLSGTLGLYYSKLKTRYAIPPVYNTLAGGAAELQWSESEFNTQTNRALFGELYYKLDPRWTLTLGDRLFWLSQSDVHSIDSAHWNIAALSAGDTGSQGHSPRLVLSFAPDASSLVYASASKGFRQGNTEINPLDIGCPWSGPSLKNVAPDSIWSYEAGAKIEWPQPGLTLSVAAFHVDWDKPQQQFLEPSCGLFVQGNLGKARIDGAELELSGQLGADLKMRLGLGYLKTEVVHVGNTAQRAGSRLEHAPRLNATLGLVYSFRLSEAMKVRLMLDYSHTGDSLSKNTVAAGLLRPAYSLLNLGASLSLARAEWGLHVSNLGNARPNLGELTYIGYGLFTAQGGQTVPVPQAATLPPRSITLQYSQRF